MLLTNKQIEGKIQSHDVNFYNLDVIISVGYREKDRKMTFTKICEIPHHTSNLDIYRSIVASA